MICILLYKVRVFFTPIPSFLLFSINTIVTTKTISIMTDYTKPYAVYHTSHPTGFFYVGKGQTDLILKGEYLGSGAKLKAAFNNPAYSRDSWNVKIIQTYQNEADAYAAERRLITRELLANPYCLNLAAGGEDGRALSTMIKSGEYEIMDYVNQQTSELNIDGISVGMDSQGRYNLTDLWKLSGGEEKNKPALWLRNSTTQALILEIGEGAALLTCKGVGSFACKELVYSYAMWISPAFHLKVIRGYDAVRNNAIQQPNAIAPALDLIASAIEIGQVLGVDERNSLKAIRTEVKKMTGVDLNKFIRYMQ